MIILKNPKDFALCFSMIRGKFIVIEGQGFTGKTTQAHFLASKLKERGIEAVVVRNPGGTPSAEKVREEILKRKEAKDLSLEEEVSLFAKALKILTSEVIIPSLNEGKWVILTRFIPSTLVYQGFVGGFDVLEIEKTLKQASQNITADLYILLDLEVRDILDRLESARVSEKHAYNEKDLELMEKRRKAFLDIASKEKEKWKVINTKVPKEEVADEIWKTISDKFL